MFDIILNYFTISNCCPHLKTFGTTKAKSKSCINRKILEIIDNQNVSEITMSSWVEKSASFLVNGSKFGLHESKKRKMGKI
jgi:hypothetical protein